MGFEWSGLHGANLLDLVWEWDNSWRILIAIYWHHGTAITTFTINSQQLGQWAAQHWTEQVTEAFTLSVVSYTLAFWQQPLPACSLRLGISNLARDEDWKTGVWRSIGSYTAGGPIGLVERLLFMKNGNPSSIPDFSSLFPGKFPSPEG